MAKDDEKEEKENLRVVFYCCLFFFLGTLCRHIAYSYKRKTAYYAMLYAAGAVIGIISKSVSHMQRPILDICGPGCWQVLYIPPYFFAAGIMLEANEIKRKTLAFSALVLGPIWVITSLIFVYMCTKMLNYGLPWQPYTMLFLTCMTPDVHTVRMFFKSRYGSVDQGLATLVEFEGLMTSVAVLLLYNGVFKERDTPTTALTLPTEMFFGCLFGTCVGQLLTFWLKRIHKDIVVQTSLCTAFVYITYSISKKFGYESGVAVLCMSLVLLRAKPTLPVRSTEAIVNFIDIVRFAQITIVITVAGMEMVTRLLPILTLKEFLFSLLMYFSLYVIRFIVLVILWPFYRTVCVQRIHDLMMIWACNFRGTFNLVLSLLFIQENDRDFKMANDRLFLLANLQIAFSFFMTMPMAGFVLGAIKKYSFDYEKIAMIFRCAKVLKDLKESFIELMRKMAFIADADWDVVTRRTMIRKPFLKKYENRNILMASMDNVNQATQDFVERRMRRDSIRLLLRSQRHYLGDQFEHGLVTSGTAKKLTQALSQAQNNKAMMTSDSVIKTMAPNKFLLRLHQDLIESLRRGTPGRQTRALWLLLFLNLYFSICRFFLILFPYSDQFQMGFFIIWFYNLSFALAVALHLCLALVRRQKTTWAWLLVPTTLVCLVQAVHDLTFYDMDFVRLKVSWGYIHLPQLGDYNNAVLQYIQIIVAVAALVVKVASIAFGLPLVKKCLVKLTHSLLARGTYSQCEAGLCYLHILKDSMLQLPDSIPDVQLMRSMQHILHQEYLSMVQHLGVLEILSPGVLTALKTFIASQLLLNSQLAMVATLSNHGHLEDRDVAQLTDAIQQRIRCLANFPTSVRAPGARRLLQSLPSLVVGGNVDAVLRRYGRVRRFAPGEVVVYQGRHPGGVYVILSGLLRVECGTVLSMHSDVKPMNPVYITTHPICRSPDTTVELTNFYCKGCVIGEQAVLNDRAGHKTVRAVTEVSALFLSQQALDTLMGGRPTLSGPLSAVEKSVWRSIAIRQAVRLIQGTVSADYMVTGRKVQHMMEHAYIVFGDLGSSVKLASQQYLAVILVQGSLTDAYGAHRYVGPCFIPPRVAQVELTVGHGHRTVLLVIPGMHDSEEEEDTEDALLRKRRWVSDGNDDDDDDDDSDELTTSSDLSDGIPHRRYKDTLATHLDHSV